MQNARVLFERKEHEIDAMQRYWLEMSSGYHTCEEVCARREANLPCIGTVDAERDADFQAAYKKHCPGKKWLKNFDTVLKNLGEHATPIIEKWKGRYKSIVDAYGQIVEDLHQDLYEIADACELIPGEEFILWQVVRGNTYYTQGFGVNKYTKDEAEQLRDRAVFHGVEAEVRQGEYHPARGVHGVSYNDWEVWVKVDSNLDLRILSKKRHIPLREVVRRSWARGCNPRVAMPFLPHGYEEEQGLDFFGNDIRDKDAA